VRDRLDEHIMQMSCDVASQTALWKVWVCGTRFQNFAQRN